MSGAPSGLTSGDRASSTHGRGNPSRISCSQLAPATAVLRTSITADGGAAADGAVGQDVHAQTALVDEGAQQSGTFEPLEDDAGLGDAVAVAADVADGEVPADEAAEVEAAGEDVAPGAEKSQPSVLLGEGVDDLAGDQGQLVARAGGGAGAEGAGAALVAVAEQTAACNGVGAVHGLHGRVGVDGEGDLLDGAPQRRDVGQESDRRVERGDGEGGADWQVSGRLAQQRGVLRAVYDTGWSAEGERRDLPVDAVGQRVAATGHDGYPPAAPLEGPWFGNRTMPKCRPASQVFQAASACENGSVSPRLS